MINRTLFIVEHVSMGSRMSRMLLLMRYVFINSGTPCMFIRYPIFPDGYIWLCENGIICVVVFKTFFFSFWTTISVSEYIVLWCYVSVLLKKSVPRYSGNLWKRDVLRKTSVQLLVNYNTVPSSCSWRISPFTCGFCDILLYKLPKISIFL